MSGSCYNTYMVSDGLFGMTSVNMSGSPQQKYRDCISKCTADNVVTDRLKYVKSKEYINIDVLF